MSARWVRSFLARQRLGLWSAAILALTLLITGALLMAALEANLRREVDEALVLPHQTLLAHPTACLGAAKHGWPDQVK